MAEELALWGEIVKGPNRWDLIIRSLCQAAQVRFDVILDNKDGSKEKLSIQIQITGIDADRPGGNCDDWIIHGHAMFSNEGEILSKKISSNYVPGTNVYFYASYSTESRWGKIKFYLSSRRFIEDINMELLLH